MDLLSHDFVTRATKFTSSVVHDLIACQAVLKEQQRKVNQEYPIVRVRKRHLLDLA